jgi:hypothetical protein
VRLLDDLVGRAEEKNPETVSPSAFAVILTFWSVVPGKDRPTASAQVNRQVEPYPATNRKT